jgi:HK97 family phage major capsid protein
MRITVLRRRRDLLTAEQTDLQTRAAAFPTREAELTAQVQAAQGQSDLAAAEQAIADFTREQETVRDRLAEISNDLTQVIADIDAAEAAAAAAAAGDPADTASTRSSGAEWRRRCAEFQQGGRMRYRPLDMITRAANTLTTSAGVIGPTGVGGINDTAGSAVSSFIDLITVTNCTGMASYKVAMVDGDPAATAGTEGVVPTQSSTTFKAVELVGKLYSLIDYVSVQIRKWSPLDYEAKIHEKVRKALRAALSKMVITKILASAQNSTLSVKAASGAALFTPDLLSKIILSYGGDEGVDGAACLVLPKADLQAFAAVRGKNEYLPVYSIKPDGSNPSTGIIQDNNGLSCRYCLSKDVPALSTATLSGTATKGMFYGNPRCAEMGIWGDVEVGVNDGYKYGEGLLTIKGEVTADADVTVKNGFVILSATTA